MADQQKSIFVTGAGSGIGRATPAIVCAEGLVRRPVRRERSGAAGNGRFPSQAAHFHGVRRTRPLRLGPRGQAFGQVTDRRMHVLFSNAGVSRGNWIEEMSEDDIDLVIDVNLKGVLHGVRAAALPLLRETAGARIVNTASVAGVFAPPRMAVYAATKFGVRALTESLDVEFSRYGVRVVSLMPWFMDTPILNNVGGGEGSNRALRDQLVENKTPIYPVEMAAERAWDAAHGDAIHYMVGKEAERARFAAQFFNAMRNRLKQMLGDD
ncbi:MAG: SDR family NAD(P)-dependent oxidoreductase [Hyphomonadaceae bacterium]